MEIKDLCVLASFHSLASGKVFHTLNCDLLQDGESLCCSLPNQKISSCVLSTDNSNREAEGKKKKRQDAIMEMLPQGAMPRHQHKEYGVICTCFNCEVVNPSGKMIAISLPGKAVTEHAFPKLGSEIRHMGKGRMLQ